MLRRNFYIVLVDEGRKYNDNQLLPTEEHFLKS
jgi:hypothetical protein